MKRNSKPKFNTSAPSRRALPFEFRMDVNEESGQRTINGHGSVFETLSQDLGGFYEIIHRGAFDDAIEKSDIRCLFNHDPSLILGRNTAGTLRVSVNDTGLAYQNDLPDVSYARDLSVSMERGDVTQSSFAFSMDWSNEGSREDGGDYEYEWREGLGWVLHIYRVKELFDVSPVTYPAYAEADVRSAQNALQRAVKRQQEQTEQEEQREAQSQSDQDYAKIMLSIKEEYHA